MGLTTFLANYLSRNKLYDNGYEEPNRQRVIANLNRRAQQLGLQLLPATMSSCVH